MCSVTNAAFPPTNMHAVIHNATQASCAYLQAFRQRAEQHHMNQSSQSPGHHERLSGDAAQRETTDPCLITSLQQTYATRRTIPKTRV